MKLIFLNIPSMSSFISGFQGSHLCSRTASRNAENLVSKSDVPTYTWFGVIFINNICITAMILINLLILHLIIMAETNITYIKTSTKNPQTSI